MAWLGNKKMAKIKNDFILKLLLCVRVTGSLSSWSCLKNNNDPWMVTGTAFFSVKV